MKTTLLFLLLIITGSTVKSQLTIYPAPEGSAKNEDFTVKVRAPKRNWQNLHCYPANVAALRGTKTTIETSSFAYFDHDGPTEISITSNKEPVRSAKVRPIARGIAHQINGNTLTFTVNEPGYFSIEINGDIFHNLQLFINPTEKEKPNAKDANVIYFGPGIHDIGKLNIGTGKTVYIAGGAIVNGSLSVNKANNVSIKGRGILTQLEMYQSKGGPSNHKKPSPQHRNDEITIEYAENVKVEGLIVLPKKYSILIGESKNVSIANFKSFSAGGNADGIDVFCSYDVNINNIFMRNADDCIAIYGHRWNYFGNTTKIKVSNAVLWADVAHPILIGTHGDSDRPNTLSDMSFSNIDILDQQENQMDYQGCLALNAGDSNLISDIRFENIRVEQIRKGQLVNLRIMFNRKYNTSVGRGIENIHFKDVSYHGNSINPSIIAGYDPSHAIKNITFENLYINGVVISDQMQGKPAWYKTGDMANFYIGEHVENIKFIHSSDKKQQ